ncbi:uncharacterized protein PG998_010549 [Apiospora kogelbergensis]|uniref:uncharacterized protein n=1 Tax=Apiospora kogelbergensis TaxID=1337665 RepID=UPI0031302C24
MDTVDIRQHLPNTTKAFALASKDEVKWVVKSRDLLVHLENKDEHRNPRLGHTLATTKLNNLTSSDGSFKASPGTTSESWGRQSSTSTPPETETNIPSFDSHNLASHTGRQTLQLQYPQLPNEVPERREVSQVQLEYLQEQEQLQLRQDEDFLSVAVRIGVEGSPRRASMEHYEYDSDRDIISYADEDDYPPLPFPDEYWTYDAEVENYYLIDPGEDGRETKIWYPLEFLESHKQD